MVGVTWIRRDLRIHDHAALSACISWAKQTGEKMMVVWIWDHKNILSNLSRDNIRVSFIWHSLLEIDQALKNLGGCLTLLQGDPVEEFTRLKKVLPMKALFFNRDYEPFALQRDAKVQEALSACEEPVAVRTFKDQVVFEADEVLKLDKTPFVVFTPYSKAWMANLTTSVIKPHDCSDLSKELFHEKESSNSTIQQLGFTELTQFPVKPGFQAAQILMKDFLNTKIDTYKENRDFPCLDATSRMSAYLRFGNISIRELVRETTLRKSTQGTQCYLNELIWREFYSQFLKHFPRVVLESYKPKFINLPWSDNLEKFRIWCAGMTGFPIVDAGMRQLNSTGWIHNRLRMVVGSFLVKDLLINWQWGEKYFAEKLIDLDLASNNGGWQWVASTGCDSQPYFRIFNPLLQSKKFDPQGTFIKQYVLELAHLKSPTEIHDPPLSIRSVWNYPPPMVDHSKQRELAISLFKEN